MVKVLRVKPVLGVWLGISLLVSSFGGAFAASSATSKKLKVGLMLDKGGREDMSFNAAAYKGAAEAEKELGITLKVVESSDDSALEPSLRTFAQRGYELIVATGFVMQEPMQKVAVEFPSTHFLLVDSVVNSPNVRSITFKEHEGSFIVGAIAGLTTKTKELGFVGGMDIPLIRRFETGFKAGAEAINPKIHVLSNFVGSTSDAWKNPLKGRELATSQYNRNVDIIFAAAGASGMGVFDAAEQNKKFVIGVDSNQNSIKPGRVLTSMLKRVDVVVHDTIAQAAKGNFVAGKFDLGLSDGAVDYALDKFNRSILTPEVEKKVNELKKNIISGKLKVPDYYETRKVSTKSS
jgi:basic membrane protein A and related proteins